MHLEWGRDVAIISAVALLVLFLQLGNSRFWDQDEGYYATVASEMYRRGDWIVPTFNDELFAHKPPMMYWGMLLSFHCLGVSEMAARLPSALFGLGTALLVYWLGRRMLDARTGLLAALALISSFMFSVVSRSATADVHLTFFVVLAFCFWAREAFPITRLGDHQANRSEPLRLRWSSWVAVYVASSFAILSKGPIGIAFPVTILGCVHLLEPWRRGLGDVPARDWKASAIEMLRCFRPVPVIQALWNMRPLTGMVVVVLVAGPWFVAMQTLTGGHFLSEFLGVHHLTRFSQPMDNHGGPIFYYLIACLVGLYPWTAFAVPTGLKWFSPNLRREHSRAFVFVSAWIAVYLVVFSLASTKLPNYVVPAYPALALVIGHFVAHWSQSPNVAERRWQSIGWGCMLGVGWVLVLAPWVLTWPVAGSSIMDRWRLDQSMQGTVRWISLLGTPLLVGGCIGWMCVQRNRISEQIPTFVITAAAMLLIFWQCIVPLADRHQTPQDIASTLSRPGDSSDIAVLSYFRPSMVYYAGRPIQFCTNEQEFADRLAAKPAPILVLKQEALETMRPKIPEGYRIVESRPEFPRRGLVVVLSPPIVR
jgi:4-amino-4-deoxy-L-arabinose transferase-like glycosyltransferase